MPFVFNRYQSCSIRASKTHYPPVLENNYRSCVYSKSLHSAVKSLSIVAWQSEAAGNVKGYNGYRGRTEREVWKPMDQQRQDWEICLEERSICLKRATPTMGKSSQMTDRTELGPTEQ